jgi:hypothetical protein
MCAPQNDMVHVALIKQQGNIDALLFSVWIMLHKRINTKKKPMLKKQILGVDSDFWIVSGNGNNMEDYPPTLLLSHLLILYIYLYNDNLVSQFFDMQVIHVSYQIITILCVNINHQLIYLPFLKYKVCLKAHVWMQHKPTNWHHHS